MTQQELHDEHRNRTDFLCGCGIDDSIEFWVEDYHTWSIIHKPTGRHKTVRSPYIFSTVVLKDKQKDARGVKRKKHHEKDFNHLLATRPTTEFTCERVLSINVHDENLDTTKSTHIHQRGSLRSHSPDGANILDGDVGAKVGDDGILVLLIDTLNNDHPLYLESICQVHRFFQKRGSIPKERGPTPSSSIIRSMRSGKLLFGCKLIQLTKGKEDVLPCIRICAKTFKYQYTHRSVESAASWMIDKGHSTLDMDKKTLAKHIRRCIGDGINDTPTPVEDFMFVRDMKYAPKFSV